jgi:hypothetical protein
MPTLDLQVDGDDYLSLGMNSYTEPTKLPNNSYVSSMNCTCRGGLVQTRPGSRSLFTLPRGLFQGLTLYKPANGVSNLVFAVSGNVYTSAYPFLTYSLLKGVQFSQTSRFMAWETCLKTTTYDTAGNLVFEDMPHSVLIMQDGLTRAAYWDGTVARHLNPTKSTLLDATGNLLTQDGLDETPVGLWMKWSNNRLWLSRGNQIFASDIGNPLKFTEAQYLNEARAFYLPDLCTGIVEVEDSNGNPQGVLCFTERTSTLILSSIQDRTQWLATQNFQTTILPDVGCVAARSIVKQYGLIWWMSSKGIVNLNSALQSNVTSRIDVQDHQMSDSKANLSYDLAGVAGCFIENYLVESVPNGDLYNRHTWVLDQAPFDGGTNAWAGYWTGWRPIEWARGIIGSRERAFFGSVDYDNNLRVWEAFLPEQTDNGVPITAFLQTKQYLFGNRDYKIFNYAEVEFREIAGNFSTMIAVGGGKGAYQPVMQKEIVSTIGQMYADSEYGFNAHALGSSRPQSRVVRTTQPTSPSACNDACVESTYRSPVDRSFSLLIVWSGAGGVSNFRLLALPFTTPDEAVCEDNETGDKLVTPEGCSYEDRFGEDTPLPVYESVSTFIKLNPLTGLDYSYTAYRQSLTSQVDADRAAEVAAQNYVLNGIGEL